MHIVQSAIWWILCVLSMPIAFHDHLQPPVSFLIVRHYAYKHPSREHSIKCCIPTFSTCFRKVAKLKSSNRHQSIPCQDDLAAY